MSFDNIVTTIDIWSSKIKTIIWKYNNSEESDFHILWVWLVESNWMRKWNILDMEEFKNNLDKSLWEAEKMAWEQVAGAYISFNSSSMEVYNSRWVIAVWDWEINYDDIDRVLDMARNGIELPNREVLKVIPDTFTVDLEENIKSPIWMSARKLEVAANIFVISSSLIWNIRKAVADIGIEILDVYPNLISAPEWVLSKRQKELWVVCIDIWSSTTWFTLYEEWTLKYSWILPIWWDSVTNDVALWLRESIDIAEKLKIEHWELNYDKKDIKIELSKYSSTTQEKISKEYLSKIITARYEEILIMIRAELKLIWKDWMLPEWVVFVWGWVKIKWLLELAKEVLRLPSIIWVPIEKDWLGETSISDPAFSSVIWTMILARKFSLSSLWISFDFKWIFESIKKVLKKMLP